MGFGNGVPFCLEIKDSTYSAVPCTFTDDKWHKLTLGSATQSIAELWKAILAYSSGVKPL